MTARPVEGGRWRVQRQKLRGVFDDVEVVCNSDAEAIGAARAMMAEIRVIGEWAHGTR